MATVAQCRDSSNQRCQPSLYSNLAKDIISVVSLGILLICIHDFATPFRRGFQCDDETIRYPYKDSTVSSGVCYLFGSGVNVALILILEYVNLAFNDTTNDPANHETGGFQMKVYLRNIYCRLILWLFGAITSELMTDITKVTAGRLRPHFISVCRPIVRTASGEIALDEYCFKAKYEYITEYYCSGDASKQRDARLSFLSGHSSYSAYSAIFAVTYIQSTLDITKLGLIKPALQVLLISTAVYTGLTRVSDYKHHWQDVLAGLTLGTTIAAFVNAFMWPPLYRVYYKLVRGPSVPSEHGEAGEELNRFSY
uniref:Putative phosphatidate phosphatase n=1 Tax=Aceria tosichella TaxID=561515 RepID=A0A6G1SHL5_9ACAR